MVVIRELKQDGKSKLNQTILWCCSVWEDEGTRQSSRHLYKTREAFDSSMRRGVSLMKLWLSFTGFLARAMHLQFTFWHVLCTYRLLWVRTFQCQHVFGFANIFKLFRVPRNKVSELGYEDDFVKYLYEVKFQTIWIRFSHTIISHNVHKHCSSIL